MNTRVLIAALLLLVPASMQPVSAGGAPAVTAAGIPLDALQSFLDRLQAELLGGRAM